MSDGLVRILDGNTFVVSDSAIEASRWVLTNDGERLNALSTDDLQYYETRFFLVPGTGTVYIDAKLSVLRQRVVGGGFDEQLTILNHHEEPIELEVLIEAAADFADLFEVKDALAKKGSYSTRVERGRLVLGYARETFQRSTVIRARATRALGDRAAGRAGRGGARPGARPARRPHRRLPGFPRATCELQGYAYDAKVRGARLARLVWRDPALADSLEREAAELKRRFNRDFWVADRGYFALALDTEGGQVDALSSNNGHLLWSGIVDKSKAASVARHLLGPELFSGWGVRTLGTREGRSNPIGYHVGTVWPFDNSFVAWGLRNYGFKEEAARVAAGILDAAEFFDGRLPEAFGGYERSLTKYPVQYPTACSPQAWSTGAPLLLLRTMLGLEPLGEHLVVDPALPVGIGHLELLDLPGRWGRLDAFGRGLVQVDKRRRR